MNEIFLDTILYVHAVLSFLTIDELTSAGAINKLSKGGIRGEFMRRAMCCLNHIERPGLWAFEMTRCYRRNNGIHLRLRQNQEGEQIWAYCFKCTRCEDRHVRDTRRNAEEAIIRRSVLAQFTYFPDQTGPVHERLIEYMAQIEPIRLPGGVDQP